jgi:2-dehydropantoate 2-reductase
MLASKLHQAGIPVTLLDVSAALVEKINTDGLTVETNTGSRTYQVRAVTNPGDIGESEAVIFFVKAQHTASAAEAMRPLVGPGTTVVSLQNGWGNTDTLAKVFPAEQIVVGVTYHSATIRSLGVVAHTGEGHTFVGPFADGADPARAEAFGRYLEQAGLPTTVTASVKTEIWKKLILNAATLPTSALTGLCAGELGKPGITLELVDEIAAEAVRVANALGYDIDLNERLERIHAVLRSAGKGKASMLQDAEARRKTEIEVINGAVVRAAEEKGIEAPLNKAMVALIAGLERSWLQ